MTADPEKGSPRDPTDPRHESAKPPRARRGDEPNNSRRDDQVLDRVDIASMDSFPCSDPPGYY